MDPAQVVGARIGAIRKCRGLTQKELAKSIGRSANALSALERGLRKPSFDTLCGLEAALDVPMREFFPPEANADGAEHAALYGKLFDTARTLPPAELDLTVRIVVAVALWRADARAEPPDPAKDASSSKDCPSSTLEKQSRAGPSGGWVR